MNHDYKLVLPQTIERLSKLDTCVVSNAIEHFNVRLRNEGFMDGSVKCRFPEMPPKAGYAVTGRIQTSSTPLEGRCYYENMEWWRFVASVPPPRFVVIQDSDHSPGTGAFIGQIHATIAVALGCVAYATNGSVRDLPGVRSAELQVFSHNVSVSHSYAHIASFGGPVEIAGLLVSPGDLLHGDEHGIHQIPFSIADRVPAAAEDILNYEKELLDFCNSTHFSLEELSNRIDNNHRKKSCA